MEVGMPRKKGVVVDINTARRAQVGDLRSAFEAKLKSSGLSLPDGQKLRLEILDKDKVRDLGHPAAGGFKIPYPNINRAGWSGFYRLRYLQEPSGWDRRKKALRYVQPPGTLPELYLPPLAPWPKILKDPTTPILLTEGELKAACVCKHGAPTAALGGVWSWKSGPHGIASIPALATLAEGGRKITIVFDADAGTNPDVSRARAALAAELTRLGATVFISETPPLPQQPKAGLDDVLVANGKAALASVVQNATPYEVSGRQAALEAMSLEVLYVRDPGLVLVRDSGQRLSANAFVQHAYANRKYTEETLGPNGSPEVREFSTAREWLEWEERAEVGKLVYAPGQPQEVPQGINLWPGWGATPKRGDVGLWRQLMDLVFLNEKEARQWFERWLAYPLQNPGAKLLTASVLWGRAQGTGKTLIGHTMFKLYGKDNCAEITGEELHAPYNEWAENKQFILGEEIAGGEGPRKVADRVKAMITRQTIRINPKYVPAYQSDDRVNYLFTSNHPDAFFLEDADRRFFIHEVPGPPLDKKWVSKYDKWYKSPEGAGALFYYFLHLPLGDFDPREPAHATTAKQEMIDMGRSDLGAWVARLKRDPDDVLKTGDVPIPYDLWRAGDLLAVYDPAGRTRTTANAIARELKRAGFPQPYRGQGVPVPGGGQYRLWIVRRAERYARLSGPALGKAYRLERDRERGGRRK